MVFARIRDWVKRNGTTIIVGVGLIGASYLGGSYVLSKLQEARQRSSEDRIAKENLKRRFQQNQEDCTYTVLALLPTVRDEIFATLPVEQITEQLQQERQERLKRLGGSEAPSTDYPSAPASVAEDDSKSLGSSSYIHASQALSSSQGFDPPRPRRSKAQLWQDMKINSIARALTLIYSLCLLTLLTRIQLNLLGRRTYLSSVVALAAPPAPAQSSTISLENNDDDNFDNVYGNDFETNRKYLTFSWWLLHRGSKQIMQRVMAAVKEVFSSVNIREDVSLDRLSELVMQVRQRIEGATEEERRSMKWLQYLLPSKADEAFVIQQSTMPDNDESPSPEGLIVVDPMASVRSLPAGEVVNNSLRRLLDETSDLIDSPTFSLVFTRLLDTAFSHLVDFHIASEAFKAPRLPAVPDLSNLDSRISEIVDTKCKLAHILPVFCKQAHTIAVGSGELDTIAGVAAQEALGNEYLAAIDRVGDLEAFAAVIYSSNFEYEVHEPDSSGAPSETTGLSPPTPPAAEINIDDLPEAAEQLIEILPRSAQEELHTAPVALADPTVAALATEVQELSAESKEAEILPPQDTAADDRLGESEVLVLTEDAQPAAEQIAPNFEAAWNAATLPRTSKDSPEIQQAPKNSKGTTDGGAVTPSVPAEDIMPLTEEPQVETKATTKDNDTHGGEALALQ